MPPFVLYTVVVLLLFPFYLLIFTPFSYSGLKMGSWIFSSLFSLSDLLI